MPRDYITNVHKRLGNRAWKGRSGRVCVASPNAAAARGDVAQASFDRKLSLSRDETSDLLSGRRTGRPHLAVTRTVRYAADISSSRNGQQMSTKSLQRRWQREIQVALLRRRAAMTCAVLPHPSTRAEWLLAGMIDIAVHHWGCAPPLDGGLRDHDHADSETDAAIPDEDDDIASLASQSSF